MKRFLVIALVTAVTVPVVGQVFPSTPADGVYLEQRIGKMLDLDLTFRNEEGETVRLGDYFDGEKPVVLTPVYYSCPMLCNLVLDGMVNVARELRFDIGDEYDVLSVSFDHMETPEMAVAKKEIYAARYGREEVDEGWHFLTGEKLEIRQLMDSIGFGYSWDDELDEYAHAAVVVVVNPDGEIARYFYGFEYDAKDLRLALVEASKGGVGSVVEQALLLCYSYDPARGQYTASVMKLLRLGGSTTALALGGFIFIMVRRERKRKG